jgi:exportin-1
MALAAQNVDVLNNPDNVKMLGNILKTNVAACSSIGAPFITQIGRIYMDLLGVYKAVSELISQSVATQGPIALKLLGLEGCEQSRKKSLN